MNQNTCGMKSATKTTNKPQVRYYYRAGVFPHNCCDELFCESLQEGLVGKGYSSPEEIRRRFEGENCFYRIFALQDDGSWGCLEGYAPNGSRINDRDWEVLSRMTTDMLSCCCPEYLKCRCGLG